MIIMSNDENEDRDDVYLSLRVSKDLDDKITEVKDVENFNTKSELLRYAIRQYLNNRRIDNLEDRIDELENEFKDLKNIFKTD